jgi:hypothetical protein
MDMNYCCQINYTAVAISSIILFIIGSAWFSPLLFSNIWMKELGRHNVTRPHPTPNELYTKMAIALVQNIIISLGMATLVNMLDVTTLQSGLCLGLMTSVCFVAPTLGSVFLWEGRSLTLYLIDFGYAGVSLIVSSVFLSWWR